MGEVDPKLLEMAEVFHLPAKMPGLSKLMNRKSGTGAPDGGKKQKGGSHR